MRSITSLVAVLAVTPFISVTAQQRLPFKPGDRVRIITATGDLARAARLYQQACDGGVAEACGKE